MAYLIKRSSNAEIDITDGVTGRMPLPTPVWQEWVKILGVPAPGYTIVSDALWNSLPVLGVIPAPPPPAPNPTPTPVPAPVPPGAWPTRATSGVPAGFLTVAPPAGWAWRTSTAPAAMFTTEIIGGVAHKVFTGYAFNAATEYVIVDDPRVCFRKCAFTASGTISNTMSLVQLQPSCAGVIAEDCDFDGGGSHNRCLWGDSGDIVVRRCYFTRFGNSAVEKNDRTGMFSIDVSDSCLVEVKGWPASDHADGVQMGGGKSYTVRHCSIAIEPFRTTDGDTTTFGAVSNSCASCWAELGNVTGDVLIDNNLLAGGGSVMYVQAVAPYVFKGKAAVTNNVFDRKRYPSLHNTASVWFVLAPTGVPSQLVWSGNRYEDGTVVSQATAVQATQ